MKYSQLMKGNMKKILIVLVMVILTTQLRIRNNNHGLYSDTFMEKYYLDKYDQLTHGNNNVDDDDDDQGSSEHSYVQDGDSMMISQQQKHFASTTTTNSMQINYTQQIVKLSNKLKPAGDINNRLITVKNSYLDHDDSVRLLANFTFTQLNTKDIDCKNTTPNVIQSLLYRTSQIRTQLQNVLDTNQVNFIANLKERQQIKQSIENEIIYLNGLEKFLESGCSKNVLITKTFYVSNPNANNWILGEQTYDQFIKSYLVSVNSQQNISKCPLTKPYYDPQTNDCVNCFYPNNVWDMKLQKCSSCPYAQVVNLKTRKCVSQIKYVNNIMDDNYAWITKEKNLQRVYEQFRREKSQQYSVVCPFDTPFILNEKCSTCPQKFVYSLDERRCMAIPYRMEYDRNLHKVVQKLQGYQTSEGISSNIIQGLKGCPNQFPYYDEVTCIDCQFPNYFNQRMKRCQPCVNLDFCAGKKLTYVTNSLAPNLTARSTKEIRNYFDQNAQKIKDDSNEQCPINTPYYNPSERRCIQCPPERYLFNISSLTCVSCPGRSFFNQTTYLCEEPKGAKTNSKATNLILDNITRYNQEQSKITGPECSELLPYFNGRQCQSCPAGQLFNTTSKSCVVCPAGTFYDNVMMKCDIVKYKTYSGAERLWIKNRTIYDTEYKKNTAKQCPATEPFYNGTACIKCLNEEIFNTTSLKCTKCPIGTTFDTLNKNCSQSKANLFIPGKTDNLLGVPSYTVDTYLKQLTNPDEKLYNVTKCADDQNSIKTGCVKCTENYPLFNVKTLQCVQCKNFDQTLKICYDNMTYITNTTKKEKFLGVQEGDVDRYVKEQETKIKQNPDLYLMCPQDKPFSIKGQCQNCDGYFNVSSGQCTVCDYFDSINRTCTTRPYVSNLKYGVPPYYTKNATRVIQEYNNASKQGKPVCPFNTPFFNGKQCIVCPKTDQYFNLDVKRCQNCSAGYQFNPIIYECQEQPPKFYTPLESSNLIFDGQPISYYEYKIQQAKKAGSGPCPTDKPYYTMNNQCEICKSPTIYFNLLRRVCTICPQNTTYNPTDHECESPIGDVVTPQPTLEKSLANSFT